MTVLRIFKLIVLAGVLIFTFGASQSTTAQQNPVIWSEPEKLGDGWWHSITVDRTGTVHVGWYGVIREGVGENIVEHDLLMYTRRSLDGEWTTPVDVVFTGDGGSTVRNAFGVTSDGRLHAYLRAGVGHDYTSVPSQVANIPEAWAPLQQFIEGYYLDFLVDNNDVLHAVSSGEETGEAFNESEALFETGDDAEGKCIQCFNLFYYRSTDGGRTWSFPQRLTNEKAGADKVDIWQGVFTGRLYMDWNGGQDWYRSRDGAYDGRLIYSDDGGVTWSPEIVLNGAEDSEYELTQLSVTEMRDGALMAVWHYYTEDDPRIYFQISQDLGQTWSEPQIIPELYRRSLVSAILDDYELITDLSGSVHLFVVGRLNPVDEASLFHVEYRQGAWRRPQLIFTGSRDGGRPEWPQAVVGPQNDIHLTWFIRLPSPSDIQRRIEVYYSHRTATLPDRPILEFVPTATPTQETFAPPAPTLTPFPTVQPLDTSASVNTTSDLYAIETLLSAFFVGAIICGIVLFAVGFRPRR
jgi:hypothetical protein